MTPSRRRPRCRARSDRGGDQVVGEPFEEVHLHEMAAPRADRARDAELPAALRGEHDEDQEDEQDAGGDREAAEGREERHEGVALRVGLLEAVLLLRVEPRARAARASAASSRCDLVAQLHAARLRRRGSRRARARSGRAGRAASVRVGRSVSSAAALGAGAVEVDDRLDAERARARRPREDVAAVAALARRAPRPRPRSGRPRAGRGRRATTTSVGRPDRRRTSSSAAGSLAKSVTRGSFCRVVGPGRRRSR